MNRLVWVLGVLAAVGLAALVFVWSEPEPSNEQSTEIACAYYGASCVPPAIFSRAYFRLFP
ncbi:hypothetical protein [Paraburkholderia phytofirmans]|jgi:hypothetical protein|uniref:hypothetical protein n=1 Tax=Paraburkholderia phytofirmans TaxID=261302 RepID=UPI0011E03C04|nr:hypothetical protein [Paraburkholderia phytofirmans]